MSRPPAPADDGPAISLAPLWLIAGSFACGTALGCAHGRHWAYVGVGSLGLAVACLRRSPARFAGVMTLVFGLGAGGSAWRCDHRSALSAMASDVPECHMRGEILETAGGLGTLARVETAACSGHLQVRDAGVVVLDGTVGSPGAGWRANGLLLPLRSEGFELARSRLGANAYLYVSQMTTTPPVAPAMALAAAVRRGLRRAVEPLGQANAGLLRGLAIGDTGGLDAEIVDGFRRAGLSHLLAVSGSNVAIVLAAAGVLVAGLGLRPRLLLAGAALALFVLVVGPEPSVLRAAVMGGIGLCALAFGRRAEPLHALPLALIALLALRPGLVFSVGLHLSAAATTGIVLWARPLSHVLAWLPRPAALGMGATLAAQTAVTPLLVGVFGELSVAAPLANALALLAVPPATVLALGAGVLATVSPAAGKVMARAAEPFAAWIVWVGDHLGGASWASHAIPEVWGLALGVPVVIGALVAARRA